MLTTLLTLAGGLDTPTSGQVLVNGVDLGTAGPRGRAALRRTAIGYVFQDYNLIPALTAAENVALPLELDGLSTRKARRLAVAALEVENVVVLGHGRCGGIRAALNPGHALAQGDFIGKWMSMLAPVSAEVSKYTFLTASERETVLERLSVRNSIQNLRTFPYIREREADGRLKVHGAWFDISTGELWVMDPETGDFSRPDLPETPSLAGKKTQSATSA